jgi:hypothetical protein
MPPVADKLVILFLAANPADTDPLKLDEELRAIDQELRKTAFRDRFDLRSHWAVRYGDLQELLLRYQPHIVHFSGHGSAAGEIILKNQDGSQYPVPPDALASLFAILKDNIRCVVLNACYTQVQAEGIAVAIECVIGMRRAVPDASAIEFAAGFYLGLGFGRSVKTAFDLGCNRIGLASGSVQRHLKLAQAEQDNFASDTIPCLIALRTDPAGIVLVNSAAAAGVTPTPISPGSGARLTRLTGAQFKQFQDALLSAFDADSLREMVKIQLEENLDNVTKNSSLRTVVFELIDWAQRTGNLDRLLDGALTAVPGSSDLQNLATTLRG